MRLKVPASDRAGSGRNAEIPREISMDIFPRWLATDHRGLHRQSLHQRQARRRTRRRRVVATADAGKKAAKPADVANLPAPPASRPRASPRRALSEKSAADKPSGREADADRRSDKAAAKSSPSSRRRHRHRPAEPRRVVEANSAPAAASPGRDPRRQRSGAAPPSSACASRPRASAAEKAAEASRSSRRDQDLARDQALLKPSASETKAAEQARRSSLRFRKPPVPEAPRVVTAVPSTVRRCRRRSRSRRRTRGLWNRRLVAGKSALHGLGRQRRPESADAAGRIPVRCRAAARSARRCRRVRAAAQDQCRRRHAVGRRSRCSTRFCRRALPRINDGALGCPSSAADAGQAAARGVVAWADARRPVVGRRRLGLVAEPLIGLSARRPDLRIVADRPARLVEIGRRLLDLADGEIADGAAEQRLGLLRIEPAWRR